MGVEDVGICVGGNGDVGEGACRGGEERSDELEFLRKGKGGKVWGLKWTVATTLAFYYQLHASLSLSLPYLR